MPRDGSGRADNAIEPEHDIAHGAGGMLASEQPDKVERANKVAPPPEPEKGAALDGLPASGGGSTGVEQGPNQGRQPHSKLESVQDQVMKEKGKQ